MGIQLWVVALAAAASGFVAPTSLRRHESRGFRRLEHRRGAVVMSGTGTRRSMVESVKVCYLFARYFATPVRRSLVSLLVSPLASALRRGWLPRRLREALPGSAAAGDL